MNKTGKTSIDRFEVIKRLGEGFQGTVYLAWDPHLERKVALKVITASKGDTNCALDIIREARIAARISHANVIPIYEVTLFRNIPLLVFEYVEGKTLRQYLDEHGPLNEKTALSIMLRIAAGLSSAHEQDIVHLDISPGNVMIDSSNLPRIMDFGLARISTSNGKDKQDKRLFGTPRYISPEHFARKELTATTDVFSLGLVFYELLTGVAAFNQKQINDIFKAIENAEIDWGKLQFHGLSAELIAVLRDMLQLNPAWRYQNATELLSALEEVHAMQNNEAGSSLALKFLLRRLDRRPEFPACSHSIGEINRLTEEGSNTDFNKLAAVIAREYSLTNRVLKIANSVVFDRNNDGVKTISLAIARLGLTLVRMICNGLLLFKQVDDKDSDLKDILVSSFVAALIARHIMTSINRRNAEEAFICALFHHLGTHLLVFYLPDEYADISSLIKQGESRQKAERAVLSTSCAALGAAVAEKWNFPETIRTCMTQLPPGVLVAPVYEVDTLCHTANFANEMCALFSSTAEGIDLLIEADSFSERHQSLFASDSSTLAKLAMAVADKFSELAPGLGVNYNDSRFCQRLNNFTSAIELAQHEDSLEPEALAS